MEASERRYLYVLPVLFLEYLALRYEEAAARQRGGHRDRAGDDDRPMAAAVVVLVACSLTRALLPSLMVESFGNYTYHVLGIVETVKGILAFVVGGDDRQTASQPASQRDHTLLRMHHMVTEGCCCCLLSWPLPQSCPLLGKLSDVVGRRAGLLFTVVGTTMPVTALALTHNMWVYAAMQVRGWVGGSQLLQVATHRQAASQPPGSLVLAAELAGWLDGGVVRACLVCSRRPSPSPSPTSPTWSTRQDPPPAQPSAHSLTDLHLRLPCCPPG